MEKGSYNYMEISNFSIQKINAIRQNRNFNTSKSFEIKIVFLPFLVDAKQA